MTLPNIVQTTVSAPLVANEAKLEITYGTQSPTKQPDTDNPATPADKSSTTSQPVTQKIRVNQIHLKSWKRTLTKPDKTN